MFIPKIPPQPPASPVESDLRVRTDSDEVLAGLDEEGRLFHVWGNDFAVGPRNVRYSLATLLEMEAEGVVAVSYPDHAGPKGMGFQDYLDYAEEVGAGWGGVDDEGTHGNSFPKSLTWVRA
ncbi:MAG: hypothetical protein GY772_06895 [bacterium]|nr:hypothetical protein [bacterium]